MTVTATVSQSGPFTPDGTTTTFPFTFAAVDPDEVAVVRRRADGTETPLAGYTVALTSGGGSAVFAVAPTPGDPIYIFSDPSFEQQIRFANQGAWSPSSLDDGLDRAAIRDIYLRGAVSRAPLVPIGETIGPLPAKALRAGLSLGFDAVGDPVATTPGGADAALRTDLASSLSGALLIAWKAAGVGAIVRTLWARLMDLPISVRDFGAKGDGVTDDRAAIQAAIDAVSAAGGGQVKIPIGTFIVGRSPTDLLAIKLKSGTILAGEGRGGSIIKLKNGATTASLGCNTVSVDNDVLNVTIRDLTIDGNRANQVNSSHVLRLAGGDGITIEDVVLMNAYSYGMGCEDGTHTRLKVHNLVIHDTGADGIDFKNRGSGLLNYDGGTASFNIGDVVTGATSGASGTVTAISGNTAAGTLTLDSLATNGPAEMITDFIDNETLQVSGATRAVANGHLTRPDNKDIHFSNISIRRWGLRSDLTAQAGFDCRGPIRITNLTIEDPGANDAVGFRCRYGEALNVNGIGGHNSDLVGFSITMNGVQTQVGLVVQGRNVSISNGLVASAGTGVLWEESGGRLTGVTIDASVVDGVKINSATNSAGTFDGAKTTLTAVRAVNGGGDGFDITSSNVQLIGCQAEACANWGVRINQGATGTKIIGGQFTGNTSGAFTDAGTSTTVRDADGITDKVNGNPISGTYTPTLTGVSNVASSTAYSCQWLRVGNIITVSGKVDITATAGAATTQLRISLPLASNIANDNEVAGTAASSGSPNMLSRVFGDPANDAAIMLFTADGTALRSHWFTFTYRVL